MGVIILAVVTGVIPWTLLAALAYLANTGIGIASLRGRRIDRRWHAGMFAATSILTIAAAVFSLPDHWGRSIALVAALVPLAFLPFASGDAKRRPIRHVAIAAAAAPGFAVAVTLWLLA